MHQVFLNMLYSSPEWMLLLAFVAMVTIATELGFRLGQIVAPKNPNAKSQIPMVVSSMLGVLGLLLGFSMSMAVSRYETRKLLVVDEANALGTSYLRTQLLPDPEKTEISRILREYVDALIRGGNAGEDLELLNATRADAARLQTEFWNRTVAYGRKDPNPVTSGLLLQSLNQSIDLAASRWMAFFNHVPESVIFVDALIALLSAMLIGYELGLDGRRQLFTTTVLTVTIALIWIVIIDMDRPHHGLIQIGQQPLIDLQDQLRAPLN